MPGTAPIVMIAATAAVAIFIACGNGGGQVASSGSCLSTASIPPDAPEGTKRACVLGDPQPLIDKLKEAGVTEGRCAYDPSTDLADCEENGSFFTDDGIEGDGAFCILNLLEEKPLALTCRSTDPPQSRLYAIVD